MFTYVFPPFTREKNKTTDLVRDFVPLSRHEVPPERLVMSCVLCLRYPPKFRSREMETLSNKTLIK